MAITINIAGNVILSPETINPLVEEMRRGVSAADLQEVGHTDIGEGAEEYVTEPDPQADAEAEIARAEGLMGRFAQAGRDATARANFLRNVSFHADRARMLEGFQTNHDVEPNDPGAVNTKQHKELLKVEVSLRRACGVCAVRRGCRLAYDADKWLDLHPYKEITAADRRPGDLGDRRPGSLLPRGVTESRTEFLETLEEDPLAHCDPRTRKTKAA